MLFNEQAKVEAARQGTTVGGVFESALRGYLERLDQLQCAELPDLPVLTAGCVSPGVDLDRNAALRELLDEGLEINALR
ncbi:MAG: antitoxin [Cyanobacteria bacterium M_surface_9_m1_291]|nr:antitoxin [Cyanobacteria bacterium M_surface_9_m1_291]